MVKYVDKFAKTFAERADLSEKKIIGKFEF